MMSKADKMFKELGYTRKCNYKELITYERIEEDYITEIIIAYYGRLIHKQSVCKKCGQNTEGRFDKKEILAICEKMKEKGCIEC